MRNHCIQLIEKIEHYTSLLLIHGYRLFKFLSESSFLPRIFSRMSTKVSDESHDVTLDELIERMTSNRSWGDIFMELGYIPMDVKKTSKTIPRFCRDATACTNKGCRYVHSDTISRINKPCGFGTECGKDNPTKRIMCLYIHPGEEWSTDLVVHRTTR